MPPRQRHWINPEKVGTTTFVTSTCLDFAHLFARYTMKEEMVKMLIGDCILYRARLHCFVVMSHHIHVMLTPNEQETISELVGKIKRNSARHLGPMLNDCETKQLEAQVGLGRRQFWKRSFRGFEVTDEHVFRQKLYYTHENPVRASIVEDPALYRWSSSHLYQAGLHDGNFGLDLDACMSWYS